MMNIHISPVISKTLLIVCALFLSSPAMSPQTEYTTLMAAISDKDLSALDAILSTNIKIPNAAMHLALAMGQKDIVMLLLDNGADKTFFMAHFMWLLVHDDVYHDVGQQLLAVLTNDTIAQHEKLHQCLVALKLLPDTCEMDELNRTPQKKENSRAVTLDMVQELFSCAQPMQHTIDFSQALSITLILATMSREQELMRRTVLCGADVNYRDGLPLTIAMSLNCATTTTTLLSLGARLTDDILKQSKAAQASDWLF